MKNHLVFLIFFSIVFISLFGCEDNSINNPVSTDAVNKTEPFGINTLHGTIILDHKLVDPVEVSNYYLLNGHLNYSQRLEFIQSPKLVEPSYQVTLDISIDAKIKSMFSNTDPNTWDLRAESTDRLTLTESGNYILVKSYPIDSMPYLIELVCTFTVTTDGLKLDSVNLRSPVV